MELHIKKKVYLKPYQNSFERVNFSVKFEVAGGGRETVAGRGRLWVVQAKLRLVVDGHGDLSISLIFIEKVKNFTAFLTLNVSRETEHFIFKQK